MQRIKYMKGRNTTEKKYRMQQNMRLVHHIKHKTSVFHYKNDQELSISFVVQHAATMLKEANYHRG